MKYGAVRGNRFEKRNQNQSKAIWITTTLLRFGVTRFMASSTRIQTSWRLIQANPKNRSRESAALNDHEEATKLRDKMQMRLEVERKALALKGDFFGGDFVTSS